MTAPTALLIVELHAPDPGFTRSLYSIDWILVCRNCTVPNQLPELQARYLYLSLANHSAGCDPRKNSLQTP